MLINSKKVLIAYGSRYGSTEGISLKIGDFLKEKNDLDVDILNLQRNDESKWPLISDYDGVLIGSGIRIGKWTKEAVKFLRGCKENNKNKNLIVGVFVSCGYAADPKYYPVAIKVFIERVLKDVGIKPNIYDAFGGVFDYSNHSQKNLLNRTILKWGARDLNINIKYDSENDYRNWQQIQNFTEEFSTLVNNIYQPKYPLGSG